MSLIVSLGKLCQPLSVCFVKVIQQNDEKQSENPVCKPEENWFCVRANAFESGLFLVIYCFPLILKVLPSFNQFINQIFKEITLPPKERAAENIFEIIY